MVAGMLLHAFGVILAIFIPAGAAALRLLFTKKCNELVIICLFRSFGVHWRFIVLLECERCIKGLICIYPLLNCDSVASRFVHPPTLICRSYPLWIFSLPSITGFLLGTLVLIFFNVLQLLSHCGLVPLRCFLTCILECATNLCINVKFPAVAVP